MATSDNFQEFENKLLRHTGATEAESFDYYFSTMRIAEGTYLSIETREYLTSDEKANIQSHAQELVNMLSESESSTVSYTGLDAQELLEVPAAISFQIYKGRF